MAYGVTDIKFVRTGWVCPTCNKSYSPDVIECNACNFQTITTTSGTGVGVFDGATNDTKQYLKDSDGIVKPLTISDHVKPLTFDNGDAPQEYLKDSDE